MHVVTVNPEFLMYARRDHEFRRVLSDADLVTADGFGLRLAASYLSKPITWLPIVREVQALGQGFLVAIQSLLHRDSFPEVPALVTGTDLVPVIAERLAQRRGSLYLLDRPDGLRPDTVTKAAQLLHERYPGLRIVGAESAAMDDRGLVSRINTARPDCLLVAFGFPEQDLFIGQNRDKLRAKVAIGVGGAFDYLTGARRRPPAILRGKFEWLWRLLTPSGNSLTQHGHRARRIFTAFPLFPLAIFSWKLRWGAGLTPIRAITFDFGGVTNQNGVEVALRRGWQLVPVLQWPVLALFYFRFIPDLERGKIPERLVWENFLRAFGSKRDLASLRSKIIEGYKPNGPLWDLVRSIRESKAVRLAMLTNNIDEWMAIWEQRYKLSEYFNPLISSSAVGLRKPNPAIFRYLIGELRLPPEEIVFVDDHFRNVLQARRLGLKAIRCTDPEWSAQKLQEIIPLTRELA